jgi:hypothetical protein
VRLIYSGLHGFVIFEPVSSLNPGKLSFALFCESFAGVILAMLKVIFPLSVVVTETSADVLQQ